MVESVYLYFVIHTSPIMQTAIPYCANRTRFFVIEVIAMQKSVSSDFHFFFEVLEVSIFWISLFTLIVDNLCLFEFFCRQIEHRFHDVISFG